MGKLAGLLKTVDNKIKAYHGSPHDFDKFSTDSIGTGEGAQAYGHGLYFADSEGVAKSYRDDLTSRDFEFEDWLSKQYKQAESHQNYGRMEMYERAMQHDLPKDFRDIASDTDYDPDYRQLANEIADELDNFTKADGTKPNFGKIYEVNIDASPDDLLDYDAPLKDQSPKVQKAIDDLMTLDDVESYSPDGVKVYLNTGVTGDTLGHDILGHYSRAEGSKEASQFLNYAGIKGIKYDDAMSRGAGRGNTKNYVIFDDKLISIAKKYGVTLPVASAILAGTMTPEQAQASQDFTQRRANKKDQWKALRESVTGAHPLESFKYPPVIEQTIKAPKSETLLTMARGAQAYNDFVDKPLINLIAPELPAELWRKQAYGQPTTLGERSLAALAMSPI